ncbi:MAG: DUF1926 domain-containing protein [Elusimicrobia bacterium]|nr:DUF1926 domain-containing protein [Elusimicrobiota bacterium]
MKKINFIFGVHNHQPVGNFKEVLDKGYELAYKPFLELMENHPSIKWSLHCSGVLWDYFREFQPEYIDKTKQMHDNNQVELIGGGYYEPVMPALPDRDKIGQIKKMSEYLKNEFNSRPEGLWLAERVWEPHLPKIFAIAGVKYTVVDDYHFLSSGLSEEERTGYYLTEEQGQVLKIFTINQMLRYYIPFRTVEETIDYFRKMATEHEGTTLVMIDDGEKFGLWPHTHKHVYTDGWLDRFLKALEDNSDWITSTTPGEVIKKYPARGKIYLPTASYFEMTQWALPRVPQEEMEDVMEELKTAHSGEKIKKFVRGGIWRNFMTKYPETNIMHKKMLYVSDKINNLRSEFNAKSEEDKNQRTARQIAKALDFLYEGQCNCAYWHGVFGGLYLPHLRKAIYEKLILAEKTIEEISGIKITVFDFDKDSQDEIIIETSSQNLYISPQRGGSIFEWDLRDSGVNLLNTLTRRQEAYHRRLIEFMAKNPAGEGRKPPAAVESIHDIVEVKEGNLDQYLNYDWYTKASLLDHFPHPETSYESFSKCQYGEQGDFVLERYDYELQKGSENTIKLSRDGNVWVGGKLFKIKVEKEIRAAGQVLGAEFTYKITNSDNEKVFLHFGPELNFSFLGTQKEDCMNKAATQWVRVDEPQKTRVIVKFEEETNFWVFPVETVSLSESGFERTYQGTSVMPWLKFELEPDETKHIDFKVIIERL